MLILGEKEMCRLSVHVLIHDEYIQSKDPHMVSVRCSSLHKETIHSACFSGTQCATLPAWQITSSRWEIVVVGGWCSGWGMMHPTHYTAELLPQRKLMSPPCNDDTQCGVTYDVCTNSKHIGRGRCSFWLFYVGHMRCAGARCGRKDVFHATHKGKKNNALEMWLLISQEITMQSYVVHVRDFEPWKKFLRFLRVLLFLTIQ